MGWRHACAILIAFWLLGRVFSHFFCISSCWLIGCPFFRFSIAGALASHLFLRFVSHARWTPCCAFAGFPYSSVLPCAYLFAIAVLMPKKSREAPHTLNMSWLDLNTPVPVEEEEV
jgi:uncharacterized membrane protein YcfT